MIPNYAKLLLCSNAVLPVLIVDGTFQSSIYRGAIIIVMVVSSNCTNIPVGWAWSPSENADTIELILKLIHHVNNKIKTFISDESVALKISIKTIFPNAVHKLIKDSELRYLFWKLVQADHPLMEYQIYIKMK